MWELDLGKALDASPDTDSSALAAAKIGANSGREQSGKRKALVIADQTSAGWGLVIAIPSTTSKERSKDPFAVPYRGSDKEAVLLVNQIRAVSTKRLDGARASFKLDDEVLELVEAKLAVLLGLDLPA